MTPDLSLIPRRPGDAESPVFREPWEAQAFAMVVSLYERGVFAWSEWAAALAAQIAKAQAEGDADLGDTYYHHWLSALEGLVQSKGLASANHLERFRHAWDSAADRTPHGQPIELRPGDFESAPGSLA
jgi:nitrile hydratase accessory protein